LHLPGAAARGSGFSAPICGACGANGSSSVRRYSPRAPDADKEAAKRQ